MYRVLEGWLRGEVMICEHLYSRKSTAEGMFALRMPMECTHKYEHAELLVVIMYILHSSFSTVNKTNLIPIYISRTVSKVLLSKQSLFGKTMYPGPRSGMQIRGWER